MKRRLGLFTSLMVALALASPAHAESLRDVVAKAVTTSPSVEAADANRRATAMELRQAEGRLFPKVDLDADVGKERIDRPQGFAADVNDQWRTRRQVGVSVSQIVFDGWERCNEIYRNEARVSAAAFRVSARSEIVALDAVEAYIDVRRHRRVIGIAEESLKNHRAILSRVREQAKAGKISQSDVTQAEERVAATEAGVERVRQSLMEAEAKFKRVVGEAPGSLDAPGYPPGVPTTRSAALEAGASNSPLVAAAGADTEVARLAFEQSKSALYPTVSVEMRGLEGEDIGGTPGLDRELNARLVLRWNIFDGLITRHRRIEFAERVAQASAEESERLRLVQEEIDRALAAYLANGRRLVPLRTQARLANSVVTSYETEYGLSKRSLLELLDAENARFNAAADVANTEALHVFSAYRILAGMGGLLKVLDISVPGDGVPVRTP